VFRALVGWGIAAFAVLQVIEPVLHAYHLPDWPLTFVVTALGAGFPVAAILAWVFDITSKGITRTSPAAGAEASGRPLSRPALAAMLVALGLLAAAPGLIYFFVWPGAGRARAERPEGAAADQAAPSIAVLPLVNLSSDREQEYFSDGLTEELLNLLAKVPGLQVAARTSAFAFKGKNEDVAQIGQKLHVANVLEGSVRRSGDQIRITTQLINAKDGYHLWSETYDRKIADVFAVQDEIASAVVRALKLKLLQEPGSKDGRTASVEAHDLYLRGLFLWNQRTPDSLLRAAELFREAIGADPRYALAYVGLADAIEVRKAYVWTRSGESTSQAKAAALRALEIDPDLGEAHASLGGILEGELDWAGAVDHFRRAVALKPDYPSGHQWYAEVLVFQGRREEARQEIDRALQLDPTSRIINTVKGRVAMLSRDYRGAEQAYRGALELAPDFELAHAGLAYLYALEGREVEASAAIERVSPGRENRAVRAVVYATAGRRTEAVELARELEAQSKREYVPAGVMAGVWASLGDKEKALAALREACQEREGHWLDPLKVHPLYDPLRPDPRFAQILDCLHLR